jgi:hypothetical protein
LNRNKIDEKENKKRRENNKKIITLRENKRGRTEKQENENSISYNC